MGADILGGMPMIPWLLANAEIFAVTLNLLIVGAALYSGQWWKALYWFAAALIALAVMRMNS